ncbi:MAG TPA: isoprenylcysteine carboxylmethyltransferase family protein [Methanomicrobiales archaeon]|nr:isoprenylcysteine carboxylmethyltransferase family protein [Methanomicrobiales archaeon]
MNPETAGIALACIWIPFWVYWFVSAARTRSAARCRQPFPPLLLLTFLLILGWALLAGAAPAGLFAARVIPEGNGIDLSGLAVTVLGLSLAVWARVHLGKNWSSRPTIRVGHTLVRTGPYRFVRNPIYTGLLVAYTGTAVVIGAFWAFALIFFLLASFLVRIRGEEKILLGEFGEEYERYRREVRALIPWIL